MDRLEEIPPDTIQAAGELDTTDVVSILKYLFLGQESPPGPFSRCGPDPTDGDDLTCRSFLPCGQ